MQPSAKAGRHKLLLLQDLTREPLSGNNQKLRFHEQELRAAVLALRAFNVETGLVGENVREQTLAQIRMQWWRDAVNGMYRQTPHEHPIIQALTEASQSCIKSQNDYLACRSIVKDHFHTMHFSS